MESGACLAVRSDTDLVALSIFEHAECRSRDFLGRLDDRASQFRGLLQRSRHIFDRHEKQHLVLGPLAWTDGDVGATLDSGVDERIAGESTLGCNLPAKEICVKLPCSIGICGTDLRA